jgi:hypothetical protein
MDYNIFDVKHNDSIDIPVTDGTYETGLIAERFRNGIFIIVFFDSDGNIVTPTSGMITPRMATFYDNVKKQGQWLTSSNNVSIRAVDVTADNSNYTPPCFYGPTVKGKIKLEGITGADHCRAFFWRTV